MSAVLRVAERAAVALAWAVALAGVALSVLTLPVFTSTAIRALGVPTTAGLPVADTLRLADAARAYVADLSPQPLPATWKGRLAFDSDAVSHLRDVRGVIGAARTVTGVATIALAAWMGVCTGLKRWEDLRAGMRWGAAATAGFFVLAALAGVVDFDVLFVRFHGLLFEPGTWLFSPESLLIRLFPERFWVYSGLAWAGVAGAGALLLLGASGFVPRADSRPPCFPRGRERVISRRPAGFFPPL